VKSHLIHKAIGFWLFGFVALHAFSTAPVVELTHESAMRDFRIMNALFSRAHATAFQQIPDGELPDIFAGKQKIELKDFISGVLGYYKTLHVDHTALGLSTATMDELKLKTGGFPFPLRFFGARAFLDAQYGDLPFGAEVTQINGRTIPELLQRLDNFPGVRRTDGSWNSFRLSEQFEMLHYLTEGIREKWEISFLVKGKKVDFEFDRAKQGSALVPRRSYSKEYFRKPIFAMYRDTDRVAYLAINTFMPKGTGSQDIRTWMQYMEKFAAECGQHKSDKLILDLRLNRGGLMLLSAAAAQWFIEGRVADRAVSSTHTRLLPYKEFAVAINGQPTNEKALQGLESYLQKDFADRSNQGYFSTRRADARFLNLVPEAKRHRFKKIIVLIGPATYSAGVNFARLIKIGNAHAELLGSETGSPGDGHSAELLITYRLPESQILFDVPLARVRFSPLVPGQVSGKSLRPDIEIIETIEQFQTGKDTVLDRALVELQKP
jgi:hypothetical protein